MIPVVIRAVEEERDNIAQLRAINVYSVSSGKTVSLDQIAELKSRWDDNSSATAEFCHGIYVAFLTGLKKSCE